jgi:hypothetical protein
LAIALAVAPAIRLARLVEAAPVGIEQPAVVAAADAVFLDLAVQQIRAPSAPERSR